MEGPWTYSVISTAKWQSTFVNKYTNKYTLIKQYNQPYQRQALQHWNSHNKLFLVREPTFQQNGN